MSSQKGIAHLFLILILLVGGVGLGVYLIQNKTNLFPFASNLIIGPETSFTLESNKTSLKVGEEFKVNVMVSSDFDAANTFSVFISYPTDKLEVMKIEPSVNSSSSASLDFNLAYKSNFLSKISQEIDPIIPQAIAQSINQMPVIVGKAYCSGGKPVVELNWSKVPTSDLNYYFMKSPDGKSGIMVATSFDRYQYPIKDDGFISPVRPGVAYTYYLQSMSGAKSNSVTVTTPSNCATPVPTPTATPTPTPTPIPKPSNTATPTPLPSPTPTPKPSPSPTYFIKKWIEQKDDKTTGIFDGTISLVGAVPNPGFKTEVGQKGLMATITFKAKANGEANLDFKADSAIYRNSDNQNILSKTNGTKIVIGTVSNPSPVTTNTPTSTPTPTPAAKRVFITSKDYSGNLGGVSGADGKCQELAAQANLGGNWKAWISDNGNQAENRLFHSNVPYKLLNGKIIANNWDDLIDGNLNSPINITEKGTEKVIAPLSVYRVWTGTDHQGRSYAGQSRNCSNWTSSTPVTPAPSVWDPQHPFRTTGDTGEWQIRLSNLPLGYWTKTQNTSCDASLPLYCFEQESSFVPTPTPISTPLPSPTPTPTPLPPTVDGKRADLYKDSKKPNFVNDQDVSVFFTKCAADGLEFFGKPASVQPICDIFEDGKITVQDWAVLIKFRNQSI